MVSHRLLLVFFIELQKEEVGHTEGVWQLVVLAVLDLGMITLIHTIVPQNDNSKLLCTRFTTS